MFGVIGDPHIVSERYVTTKRLKRKVSQLNKLNLDFILVTGDISHRGRPDELKLAKAILDELNARYYCCHGNHDYAFDTGEDLTSNYRAVFGPIQYGTTINGYNLLVLSMREWRKNPLKFDQSLPSIALIHSVMSTSCPLTPSIFENLEIEGFLESHNVSTVFQGHFHVAKQSEIHHRNIQYISCSKGWGLGILGNPILYVPITSIIEKAFSKLISIKKESDEHGEDK